MIAIVMITPDQRIAIFANLLKFIVHLPFSLGGFVVYCITTGLVFLGVSVLLLLLSTKVAKIARYLGDANKSKIGQFSF